MALDQVGGISAEFTELLIHDDQQRVREVAVSRLHLSDSQILAVLAGDGDASVKAAAWRKAHATASGELYKLLEVALASDDPFLRQAARQSMVHPGAKFDLSKPYESHQSAAMQLAVVILQQQFAPDTLESSLDQLLRHPDERIRFIALKWIGDNQLIQWKEVLNKQLFSIATTEKLIKTSLATIDLLEGNSPVELDKTGSDFFAQRILQNANASSELRQFAIRNVSPVHELGSVPALAKLIIANDNRIVREVIAKLQVHPDADAQTVLRRVAQTETLATDIQALAVAALQPTSEENIGVLLKLAENEDAIVSEEALRSLRGYMPAPHEVSKLKEHTVTEPSKELLKKLSTSPVIPEDWKKRTIEDWVSALPPGDSKRGERVFYNSQAGGCFQCHQIHGRGIEVGPDLSRISESLTFDKILESIIEPSRNIAPRFQSWKMVLEDGRLITGMKIGEDRDGKQFYVDSTGKKHMVSPSEIDVKQVDDASIMPQDLIKNMTAQELADVITYLSTLQSNK